MYRSHFLFSLTNRFLVSGSVAVGVALMAIPTPVRAQTHSPGTFAATGNMTEPRTGFTTTRLNDGRILVVGGNINVSPSTCTNTAEIYNASSGTFTATGNTSYPRCGHTATLLRNGEVLIAGGGPDVGELFNPATGTFVKTGTELEPTANEATTGGMHSALLPDGTVLIVGGSCTMENGNCLTVPELYDPASGTFKAPPGTFSGSCSAVDFGDDAATSLPNGEVLWTGGLNLVFDSGGGDSTSNCAKLYDPSGAPAQFVPTMTTSRAGHSSTLLQNGKVLIAGGFFLENGGFGPFLAVHGSAEIYDPETNTFTTTAGALNDGRFFQTAILQPNGQVLIAGGSNGDALNGDNNALSSAELFSPTIGTFGLTGNMIVGRVFHAAVFLSNALTMEAGGQDNNATVLASAELYAPAGAVNIGSPQQGDTVSGTVSIGTEISTGVEWINIYIDGQYLTSSPPFTFSWDSTKVANGPHVVSANAYGSGGLLGSSSVSVNVANGPVALRWPLTGSTVSHKVGIGAQVSSAVEWINFYVDNNWIASSPPFTTYWDSSTVTNGTHTLSTRAYGPSGQIGTDSLTVNVQN